MKGGKMKNIYQHIGVVCYLLLGMACTGNDPLREDPFIPNAGESDQPLPSNEQWGWVGRFPGEVAAVHERLQSQEVVVNTDYADIPELLSRRIANWQSTGFYAPPSEKIKVVVPGNVSGMKYRIGVASVQLKNEEKAERYSSVSVSGDLQPGENMIYNNFGGHLYFYFDEAPRLGEVTVEVSGVVKSLDYILGETQYPIWKNAVDDTINTGMTWGELIGERVVLTLPLTALRKVKDPDLLLKYYDELISLDVEPLCGVNPGEMDTPLRIYRDIQLPLTAGVVSKCYGTYPLAVNGPMSGMESAMLNIYDKGEKEVSIIQNNILQIYGMNWSGGEVLGGAPSRLLAFHGSARKGEWAESDVVFGTTIGTINDVRQFTGLKEDEKVEMLIQLAQQYGWSIFNYITNRSREEAPDGISNEKLRSSMLPVYATEYAGQDLSAFFKAWRYPLTQNVMDVITTYPSVENDFWNHHSSELPKFDSPKEVEASVWKTSKVVDTAYVRDLWKVEVQSAQYSWSSANTPKDKATASANLVDGKPSFWITQRGIGWNSESQKEEVYNGKFPQWATFKFDQCAFNYVYLQHPAAGSHPFYGSVLDCNRRVRKFALDYLDNDGNWQLIQEFYTDRDYDGMQYFYLPQTYTCSGIRFRALSPHLYGNEGDHDNPEQTKGSGLAEFGVGLLEYKN